MSLPPGIEIFRYDPATDNRLHDTALAVRALLHGVLVEYYNGAHNLGANPDYFNPADPVQIHGQKERLAESGSLEDIDGAVYWFARDIADGQLVGMVKLGRPEMGVVELEELDVKGPETGPDGGAPTYRKKGIGRELLIAALQDPQIGSGDAIVLDVVEDNPAIRLYRRLGFWPTGKITEYPGAFLPQGDRPPRRHLQFQSTVATVLQRLDHIG